MVIYYVCINIQSVYARSDCHDNVLGPTVSSVDPLTSFEKAAILEVLQAELFRPDAHQGDPAGSEVRLELADFCSCPSANLTAKPAQEEQNHGLVLPQRLELHGLEHRELSYQ